MSTGRTTSTSTARDQFEPVAGQSSRWTARGNGGTARRAGRRPAGRAVCRRSGRPATGLGAWQCHDTGRPGGGARQIWATGRVAERHLTSVIVRVEERRLIWATGPVAERHLTSAIVRVEEHRLIWATGQRRSPLARADRAPSRASATDARPASSANVALEVALPGKCSARPGAAGGRAGGGHAGGGRRR